MPIFQAYNKIPCSKETPVMLFFNSSCSSHLVFLFLYFSSILLAKFFRYLCRKTISQRTDNEFEEGCDEEEDFEFFTVECMEKEDQGIYEHNHYGEEDLGFFTVECTEKDDLVADIIQGGDALLFLPVKTREEDQILVGEGEDLEGPMFKDPDESFTEELSHSCTSSESEHCENDFVEEKLPMEDTDSATKLVHRNEITPTTPINQDENNPTCPMMIDSNENDSMTNDDTNEDKSDYEKGDNGNSDNNITQDENFLIFHPPPLETKKVQNHENDGEEFSVDSFIEGSTSKSSSEWRSSINYRDSVTEDPFSSSSRRSCPTWESYTVFRKYDEEMMFFDRISAQKLNETELLRKIELCPRSISERIVHKLTTKNKRSSDFVKNPYRELETAYVAQICLTWEALNWNYKTFQRRIASCRDRDPGCPGQIAQQFQQFQVLLQRFIENEPYEQGRRPEVYARMRISAPKLLQVPEFRDSENDQKEEGLNTRVSSPKFLQIMEDAIRTFMNFLKADREKCYKKFTALFRRNHRTSVDLTLLHLMKKANKKKKMKLKDLRRARKCLRKAKLGKEEEMEILMGLIDLKVVSRVLRMNEISEEQLQWCQDKMSKVRLWEGKLQRDSSPLFFPAH